MTTEISIRDYPKTKAVYQRIVTEPSGDYLAIPDLNEGMEWVFEDGVRAVDKLDGTNVCIVSENGQLQVIDNRKTRIWDGIIGPDLSKNACRALSGILNSMEKGWLDGLGDGRHYGELIAPSINANRHRVDRPYWVPFAYLYEKCHWKTWVRNTYPKDFDSIKEWFRNMPSLFNDRHRWLPDILAEGLIFWHPDGRVAKLRRDMFNYNLKTESDNE